MHKQSCCHGQLGLGKVLQRNRFVGLSLGVTKRNSYLSPVVVGADARS